MTEPCTQQENMGKILASIEGFQHHIIESDAYRVMILRSEENWKRLGKTLDNIHNIIFWSVFKVFTGFGVLGIIIATITTFIK